MLDVTADDLAFGITPTDAGPAVTVKVGAASATLTQFGLSGSVTDLSITNDGFMIGSATLAVGSDTAPKSITFGNVFSITNPSVTLTNFGYSTTDGAQFDSDLTLKAKEIDLTLGGAASVSATGLSTTISFRPGDLGHFTFTADTVKATLASYLELDASMIHFDTAATGTEHIADIGKVTATFTLPNDGSPFSIAGTGQDFSILGNGTILEGPTFGVSLDVAGPAR